MKSFFVAYKTPLTVVIILLLGAGFYTYSKMQVSLFPEITFPKIKIIVDAGLQPVDRMMVTVTRPLENAIRQIPDLTNLRSTTSRGSCEVSAYLNWKADIDLSKQRIDSKIEEIRNELPSGVQITVEKMNPSILPVIGYTLETNSQSVTPINLKQVALYTVKPFLSQVQGVSEVRIIGGKQKEYWVVPDIQKMSSLSITPQAVLQAINQTNFVQSDGYIADYKMLYLTVTDASVHSVAELQNIIVSSQGNRVIQLKDFAEVKISEAVEYTKINANGREGLLVAVVKQPNYNLMQLSDAMTEKVSELKKVLPPSITIKPYYIQANFVHDSIKSVTDSLLIGLALAIIVAIIFLRSATASSTILITIPVTISLSLIVIYAVGYSLNIITLGALAAATGLLIDDAIVVVEQIHRFHEDHPQAGNELVVQKSLQYLLPAMVGSSLSTIVIFIPFQLMSGVAGAYFNVMTNTMVITLVCSFFVTWLLLPVIYLVLSPLGKRIKAREQTIHHHSSNWVNYFINKPVISLVFIAILIVSVILILPRLQTGFLPTMDEGSIVMDYKSPAGTSLQETDRMLREVEKIITHTPEVQAYSRRTGTQMGFFITEPNTGDYLIQLKKQRDRSTDDVITDIRHAIEKSQPALETDFGQVIGDMLGDLITSVQPVEVKIYGDDPSRLQGLSRQVADVVQNVRGTADVFDGVVIAGPSVSVVPNNSKMAQFGVNPADFQQQLQLAIQGVTAGNILDKQQLSAIRLVMPGSREQSVERLRNMQVFLPTGRLKPLSEFATINIKAGEAEIERENLQTIGVVTARLENRDIGSTVADIKKQIAGKVFLPRGYHIEYGGEYASQQQSFHELLIILIASCLLVFGAILFLFKNVKVAVLIIVLALLGISGSYLLLWLTNTALNVGSYTGLIMIVGIIGENAIFTFRQFEYALQEMPASEAIVFSISTRLRPKVMTALGAITALMPLALGIGAGAQLHQPLAIAVIGGLLIALPLLLIVLPTGLRLLFVKQ